MLNFYFIQKIILGLAACTGTPSTYIRQYVESNSKDTFIYNGNYQSAVELLNSFGRPSAGNAKWIWYTTDFYANQTLAFTKTFNIQGKVTKAQLKTAVDEDFSYIKLNNIDVQFSPNAKPSWGYVATIDVTSLIKTGANIFEYKIINVFGPGGISYQFIIDSVP